MKEYTLLLKIDGKSYLKLYDEKTDFLDEMPSLVAEFSSFQELLEAKINDYMLKFPYFSDISYGEVLNFIQDNGYKFE